MEYLILALIISISSVLIFIFGTVFAYWSEEANKRFAEKQERLHQEEMRRKYHD